MKGNNLSSDQRTRWAGATAIAIVWLLVIARAPRANAQGLTQSTLQGIAAYGTLVQAGQTLPNGISIKTSTAQLALNAATGTANARTHVVWQIKGSDCTVGLDRTYTLGGKFDPQSYPSGQFIQGIPNQSMQKDIWTVSKPNPKSSCGSYSNRTDSFSGIGWSAEYVDSQTISIHDTTHSGELIAQVKGTVPAPIKAATPTPAPKAPAVQNPSQKLAIANVDVRANGPLSPYHTATQIDVQVTGTRDNRTVDPKDLSPVSVQLSYRGKTLDTRTTDELGMASLTFPVIQDPIADDTPLGITSQQLVVTATKDKFDKAEKQVSVSVRRTADLFPSVSVDPSTVQLNDTVTIQGVVFTRQVGVFGFPVQIPVQIEVSQGLQSWPTTSDANGQFSVQVPVNSLTGL